MICLLTDLAKSKIERLDLHFQRKQGIRNLRFDRFGVSGGRWVTLVLHAGMSRGMYVMYCLDANACASRIEMPKLSLHVLIMHRRHEICRRTVPTNAAGH